MVGTCDFNPTWPNPPHYNGNLVGFLLAILEWAILAFGSLLFDLVGFFNDTATTEIYTALLAPVQFLYAVFLGSIPSFAQYGPLGPLLGAVVFSGVVLILVGLFLFLYRDVGTQIITDTEEMEGKSAPSGTPSSEIGVAESEL